MKQPMRSHLVLEQCSTIGRANFSFQGRCNTSTWRQNLFIPLATDGDPWGKVPIYHHYYIPSSCNTVLYQSQSSVKSKKGSFTCVNPLLPGRPHFGLKAAQLQITQNIEGSNFQIKKFKVFAFNFAHTTKQTLIPNSGSIKYACRSYQNVINIT